MILYQLTNYAAKDFKASYRLENENSPSVEKCYVDIHTLLSLEKLVTGPVTTSVKVQEGAQTRTFSVTVEPVGGAEAPTAPAAPAPAAPSGTQVFSTFAGSVEVVDSLVKVGDAVTEGQVVAAIEAMKAKHDIKASCGGTVSAIHVSIGDEIDNTKPIVSIA